MSTNQLLFNLVNLLKLEPLLNRPATATAIARQPIFDTSLNTYAYELLYRGDLRVGDMSLSGESGDSATQQVINDAFIDFGIEKVVGNSLAFINMTRNLLIKAEPLPFRSDQVVLELLEDITADVKLVFAVEKLVKQGYKIALDDFIFDPKLWPLIKLAHIIKIDILSLNSQQLEEHVRLLKAENILLLAEKVETQKQYDQCKQLGFDYFQGYFFSHPKIIHNTHLPSSQLNLLTLLNKLQDPSIDFDEIEELISHDVSLSYKLLKLLNSAAVGLPRKIDSIKQGLVILGFNAIKSWATLIALNTLSSSIPELITIALTRAKMCELVAEHFDNDSDTAFTVGLFSTLDAVLLHPMTELLEALPLTEAVRQALLNEQGQLGLMLKEVILYEQGLWDNISDITPLASAFLIAAEWTINTQNSL